MTSYFVEKPSEQYKKAVSALRKLLAEEGEDVVSRAFAEATTDARKEIFVKGRELQPPADSHVCFHRLMGETCPGEQCFSPQLIPHADHCSEWKQDGETRLIISQPYSLSYTDIKETIAFCERYGFEVTIDARSSWHFPGVTLSVQYRHAK